MFLEVSAVSRSDSCGLPSYSGSRVLGRCPSWGNCGRFRHARVTQLEQGSQCAPYSRFESGLRARLRMPYNLGHCRTPSWGDHSPAVLRGVHRMSSTSLRIGCFVSASTRCIATGTEKGWDVATGQHSLQSVEIDGDFGVKIGRRGTRAVWGLDG